MRSIAFFDGSKGYLAIFDPSRGPVEFVTTKAQPGKGIHVNDWTTFSQLLETRRPSGLPLKWGLERRHMGRDFAKTCGARLYKIREGYEGAMERMKADADQA